MAAKKIFLIDGHALCYRSFFAIRELATSQGRPTNAVFGFVNTLRKILREQKPDYLAVCFDAKGKTLRQQKYAKYKIQRPSMPEGLIEQIPIIKDVLKAYGLAIFELEGYEADDLIATLVAQLARKDAKVTIVSDDKDMFQLAGERVDFYSARKDEIFDKAALKKKLGFDPSHIIDFIALAGDTSDNIPGVTGIGEVTARELIKDFGALEDIYKGIAKIEKPKVRERLQEGRDIACLSRELAVLEAAAPIECRLAEIEVAEPDRKKLHDIFSSLEFRRLAEEYADAPSAPQAFEAKVSAVSTDKGLKECIAGIEKKGLCAIVPVFKETPSLFEEPALLVAAGEAEIFEVGPKQTAGLDKLFKDPSVLKVVYDFKGLLKALGTVGLAIEGRIFDVKLAAYLSGLSYTSSGVSDLAWRYLKRSIPENNIPLQEITALFELYRILSKELDEKGMRELHDKLEIPLSVVLAAMERHGVCIDLKLLQELSRESGKRIAALEKDLYKLAGEEFNLNSPKQLSVILFEKLKLPVVKKTKTGFSTDEGVLTKLSDEHEVPKLILEYRQLSKLKSTYIDALPKMLNERDGRIHAEFDQIGAETGRFSSRNPNLQNIPIRTELGRQIRKAFIPSGKANVIVSADYSQIELRILAHLSQDKALIKTFEDGLDVHNMTAGALFGVKEKDVTYAMRDTAKRVNFGIIYGISAFGLAKDLKISTNEAQEFIDAYFANHPKVKEFLEESIERCEKSGYATTMLKRRRYIADINSRNMGVRQFAQRQAINTPVQGSAADLMKLAMINVARKLEERKFASAMIMTVHDELVFDTPKKEEAELIDVVRREMETPVKLSVPIKVAVKSGANWLDLKEVM
jgi:DNA polymerase-1